MDTDEKLMLAYKNGDENAFEKLYQKYSASVYGYARKRLRDSERDDFFQKVWRHLHEKRLQFTDQPFAPWFFVLIRNLLIDEYRSLARRKEFAREDIERMYFRAGNEEQEVVELLQHLPPDTSELVRKYYLEGISYEELELETGMSQTGLRQRLSRALRKLSLVKD